MELDLETREAFESLPSKLQSFFITRFKARNKKTLVFYILCITLGIFGAHRFYLEDNQLGFIYILLGGLSIFGVAYDLFTGVSQVRRFNANLGRKILSEIHASYGDEIHPSNEIPNLGL